MLPLSLTTLVGRDDALARLYDYLLDTKCRLISIIGPGGVGKTRLALEVAQLLQTDATLVERFPQGCCFVPLADVEASTPHDVVLTLACTQALGLVLDGSEAPLLQLQRYLQPRHMVLLFDNVEHLPDMGRWVAALLRQAPSLTVVVTSRERLHVRGELVLALDGLLFAQSNNDAQDDAATALFRQVAGRVAPDLVLDAAALFAVRQICRLVDGLPLGIELAASWVSVLSCAEIADAITRDLDFLAASDQDVPARQQSLRAVFVSSWRLVSPAQQQLLWRLAIFRGSVTLAAAEAICNDDASAGTSLLRLFAGLVDRSLLRRTLMQEQGATRFALPESLRPYIAEQLARSGEQLTLARRHAHFYLGWLAEQTARLRGAEQSVALAAIDAEIDQVRAAWLWAVQHGPDDLVVRAAPALFHFYDMRSWFREGAERFRTAQQMLVERGATAPALGVVLAREGWFTFHLGQQQTAQALLSQSVGLLRAHGEHEALMFSLSYLGAVYSYLGNTAATQSLCAEALSIADQLGDAYGRAVACNILGQAAYDQGDYAAARVWSQQSLAIEQRLGNRWSAAYSLTNLGKVACALGEYEVARHLFSESLAIREAINDVRGVAICYNFLGSAARAQGDLVEAEQRFDASLALFHNIGNQWGITATLINQAQLALDQAKPQHALALFQQALPLAIATAAAPQVVALLLLAEDLAAKVGDTAWAAELRATAAMPDLLQRTSERMPHLLAWSWPAPQHVPASHPALAAKPPAAPFGLTQRETEVLRLVAQGLTDNQVAEQLVLSPRTVGTHLTSIYGKLQVNSRTAATRIAIEQGLV